MVKNQSAFTLVELLVVIAIIAGLTVAGFAGVSQIIEKTKATKSLSNLRQIGLAALTYAGENNGQLPQSTHQGPDRAWQGVLVAYGITKAFQVSPLDTTGRNLSYAINDLLTVSPYGAASLDFSRLQSLTSPARTFYMSVLNSRQRNSDHFHFAEEGFAPSDFEQEIWVKLTGQYGHYLFADGHVEALSWSSVQTLLNEPGSTFVHPGGKSKK